MKSENIVGVEGSGAPAAPGAARTARTEVVAEDFRRMADDNLPRRAREARRRYDKLDDHIDKLMERYSRHTDELIARVEKTAETGDPEAIMKMIREGEEKAERDMKTIKANMAELRQVAEEVSMISAEASVEGTKLRFDAIKQQATFSAAALVGITAITEGILPERLRLLWLFWATVGILLLTITVSMFLLYIEAVNVQDSLRSGAEVRPGENKQIYLYVSVFGLPAAVVAFLVFLVVNLL